MCALRPPLVTTLIAPHSDMNYRHAYHAGNFADVLKHAVLALVIEHMKLKAAPFRVIDTHAGTGLYDLAGVEAGKTGEWHQGIGRLLAERLPIGIADILSPYLTAVREIDAEVRAGTLNLHVGDVLASREGTASAVVPQPAAADDLLRAYPGSPLLARRLLRRGDVLAVNELHEVDREELARRFAGDPQTRVLGIDGWTAVKSLLPPRERRGVVLVDPPFEQPGELQRMVRAVSEVMRRFATGTVLLWYPIKDPRLIAEFHRELASLGASKLIAADLMLRQPVDLDRLNGTGLAVLNPPFTLAGKLEAVLPFLAKVLGEDKSARGRVSDLCC